MAVRKAIPVLSGDYANLAAYDFIFTFSGNHTSIGSLGFRDINDVNFADSWSLLGHFWWRNATTTLKCWLARGFLQCSTITTAPQLTVFELETWDRQTDWRVTALLNAALWWLGHKSKKLLRYTDSCRVRSYTLGTARSTLCVRLAVNEVVQHPKITRAGMWCDACMALYASLSHMYQRGHVTRVTTRLIKARSVTTIAGQRIYTRRSLSARINNISIS